MEYNSDMFQHGIMTKWFDPTFIPLLKAKGIFSSETVL